MASQSKRSALYAVILMTLALSAHAQTVPGMSGGGAMRRTDAPSGPAWRILARWSTPIWLAPRWLPGRSPVGGSLGSRPALPARRTWLRSRLP
jgi:hypothetical protein